MKIVLVIGSYQLLTKRGEQLDNKTTIRAAKVFFLSMNKKYINANAQCKIHTPLRKISLSLWV